MKFIHYLEKISGVSIYGLSSLLIFGLFFLIMTIWALRADKHMMEELRRLPLDKVGKVPGVLAFLLLLGGGVHAEGPAASSSASNPFVTMSIIIMIILALAIALLANVLLGAAQIPKPPDEEEETGDTYAGGLARTRSARSGMAGTLFLGSAISDVPDTAFYMISGVILLEVIVLLVLLYNVKLVLLIHKKKKPAPVPELNEAGQPIAKLSWWDRINRFKPHEREMEIDTGHDYDGIRELDNRLPPWWLYGFYVSILFAGIYLWRYHVSHSAPSSAEEYALSVKVAAAKKAEYLKNAANLVDENTVKQLKDAGELAAGQKIFEANCFACHGKAGEGGVGPNLTDAYWLHGGSVNEVFKSIKYGWAEKGMKSWKDDFSPSQIAQIASYVLSLQGTNPANAKAPQGTLAK